MWLRRRRIDSGDSGDRGAVDVAGTNARDRCSEAVEAGLARSVPPEQPGLPAGEAILVQELEVEESSDRGLAASEQEGVAELARLVAVPALRTGRRYGRKT